MSGEVTRTDGEDDEQSSTTSFEVSAPSWLIGLKFAKSWTTTRRQRVEHTITEAAERAGGQDVLEDAIEDDEQVGDMFFKAAGRASEERDDSYRALLGRLVGAAVADRAKVDDFEQVLRNMVRIDPFTLRVFIAAYTHRKPTHGVDGEAITYPAGEPLMGTKPVKAGSTVSLEQVMKKLALTSDHRGAEVFTALSELVGAGLLMRTTQMDQLAKRLEVKPSGSPNPNVIPPRPTPVTFNPHTSGSEVDAFVTTAWGAYAHRVCMELRNDETES